MERDRHETPIIFRKKYGELTAVFPAEPNDLQGRYMTCYAHVGQHGACSVGWYQTTKPAKPAEYADLLRELEGFGYRVKVCNKRTRQHVKAFDAQIAEWRRIGRGV